MKPWQKIVLVFLVLTVGAVIFMYSRSAKAANVSILTNKVDVPPSKGPAITSRTGRGHF